MKRSWSIADVMEGQAIDDQDVNIWLEVFGDKQSRRAYESNPFDLR